VAHGGGTGCWKEHGEVDIDAKVLAAGGDATAQSWDLLYFWTLLCVIRNP
jgi:hypothetical protein